MFYNNWRDCSENRNADMFFIDEIQYMKQNQLGSLIAALHRTNQLGYPVMIVGAALYDIKCRKNLHKSVSSISTTRAQLISKGIIYPVRYKELISRFRNFPDLSSGWMSISRDEN